MDDSRLRQDILDELEWQAHIPSEQITVTADQGTVRLSGYVATYAEKFAAEQAVKHVVGVRAAVLETLEVRVVDEKMNDTVPGILTEAKTVFQALAAALNQSNVWSNPIIRGVLNSQTAAPLIHVVRGRSSGPLGRKESGRADRRCRHEPDGRPR